MPFCRECGKEVQDDWASCPYCSQSIGPPESNKIGLQDSVVMGDVSISENSQTCPICNSQGVTISACMECKGLSFCNVCEGNVNSEREDRCGEYWYDGEVNFKAPICNQCFDSVIANSCDFVCENCDVCIVKKGKGTQYCHTCSEHLSEQQNNVDSAKTYNDWADENDDREEAKKERRTAKEYQATADKALGQFKARTSKKAQEKIDAELKSERERDNFAKNKRNQEKKEWMKLLRQLEKIEKGIGPGRRQSTIEKMEQYGGHRKSPSGETSEYYYWDDEFGDWEDLSSYYPVDVETPQEVETPQGVELLYLHEIETICIDDEEIMIWSQENDENDLTKILLTAEEFWIVNLNLEREEKVQWMPPDGPFQYWCDDDIVEEIFTMDLKDAIQTLQMQYLNTMVNRRVLP